MSVRALETGGTAKTNRTSETEETTDTSHTVSTYLTENNTKVNSARTKDSYKVRFSDGKAPGTADDGKINKEPHPQNQNWGRTGLLLIEGATIILRILFDEKVKQISNGDVAAYLKIPANYQILFDLYQGKIICPAQWKILYPGDKAHLVTSLEFDVTLLYILVIHTCQFKGEMLIDIQSIEKRRDGLYEYSKDARIIEAKFDTEYQGVGAVLIHITVSRELSRDVENRIKNMVKNLKAITMTKEEILIYLDTVKRWYLSDIDVRKGLKELKPLLKGGQGDTRKAKDILAKLKMVAEDDNDNYREMVAIKEDLEKLASELEGVKKKKTKLKTVLNILSILTPRFSQPFNIESVPLTIPHRHRWVSSGIQFAVNFYCQGQVHVYTKSTKLVVDAKVKIILGDERFPQGEIAAVKSLNSAKFREQLINDLHLGGIATLSFRERSFFIVPIESNDQGYRKLMETVQIPLWKSAVTNIFQDDQVKPHLSKGGCLCISSGGDPTVMVDVCCRGSDIALKTHVESSNTSRPTPYEWKEGSQKFVVKKYFLGKFDDLKSSSKGNIPQCLSIDLTVKKGTKVDHMMESKFAAQLNDNIDLKALLPTQQGVKSVKCDEGKSEITVTFNSVSSVKDFHDSFRYEHVRTFVNKLFEEAQVKKIFGNVAYNIYVDVLFSIPEVECKGLPEPASPTAPRRFKVANVTTTSVTVIWEEPLSNGGIHLTGYVIERYDLAEKRWVKVGMSDPQDTSYHVTNLLTSHEYFFRITAENLAGISPVVETSDPVMLSRTKATKPVDVIHNITVEKQRITPRSTSKPKQITQFTNASTFVKTPDTSQTRGDDNTEYLQQEKKDAEESANKTSTKQNIHVKKDKKSKESTGTDKKHNENDSKKDVKIREYSIESAVSHYSDTETGDHEEVIDVNNVNTAEGVKERIEFVSSTGDKKLGEAKRKQKSKSTKSSKSKKASKRSSKKRKQ